jgi:small subunit ribosomal protein S4
LARYIGSACKLCRREETKLFLKGERCLGEKCAIDRRNYPPGEHGQRRTKPTNYGLQLREKQKARRVYSILERQFRGYYYKAARQRGITGENLLTLLERRLDNMVYRMGFAVSRTAARQLVNHGHFLVNGKPVDIPSYLVKAGDVIQVKDKSKNIPQILSSLKGTKERGVPDWLHLEADKLTGVVSSLPTREQMDLPLQEQLIVELYSK